MQQNPITSAQFRAARALLNWSREKLAKKSGLSLSPIKRIEQSDDSLKSIKDKTWNVLLKIFSEHGIIFISEPSGEVGVKFIPPAPKKNKSKSKPK